MLIVIILSNSKLYSQVSDQMTSLPLGEFNVDTLSYTIVSPYLEHPIDTVKNVLWCATFQLTWNELSSVNGEISHIGYLA